MKIVVERGKQRDIEHNIIFALAGAGGELLASAGDVERLVYLRSAAKMMQALPMMAAKADEKYQLSDKHLALACSSHSGQPCHLAVIEPWMKTINAKESDMVCGLLPPINKAAARDLIKNGTALSQKYHMCSGKHLGMMTLAKCEGWDMASYWQTTHPVQQRINEQISELSGASRLPDPALDGCNVPCLPLSVKSWASALAAFCLQNKPWSKHAEKLINAQLKHPELIGGSGRICTELTRNSKGEMIVKSGVDGIIIALFPLLKRALVVKCTDGNPKATNAALIAILKAGGIAGLEMPKITTVSGNIAGKMLVEGNELSQLKSQLKRSLN